MYLQNFGAAKIYGNTLNMYPKKHWLGDPTLAPPDGTGHEEPAFIFIHINV